MPLKIRGQVTAENTQNTRCMSHDQETPLRYCGKSLWTELHVQKRGEKQGAHAM